MLVAERPWGSFKVLQEGDGYLVKEIRVRPGHRLSLQSHQNRSESWTFVRGDALVTLGDDSYKIGTLGQVFVPRGVKHRVENVCTDVELVIVEVQLGDSLSEDDIVRYSDDYNR